MNRSITSAIAVCTLLLFTSRITLAVTIDTVPVGNAGNGNDSTGFGAVRYAYSIGTTEVTNAQYVDFLNAKAASDPFGLYNANMSGIVRSGVAGSFSYQIVTSRRQMPVDFVSWYDAIRFANWLNNGQAAGDTETGAYTLGPTGANGVPINGDSITRNPGATWFLPSENEWYKAAYHNNDGSTSHYFQFPTSSNVPPTPEAPPGGTNSANYAVSGLLLTDVGAYANTMSPYGAFDMGGNVCEWNESLILFDQISGTFRGTRGGAYHHPSAVELYSGLRNYLMPATDLDGFGFRIATVPEPSTFALAALGCLGFLIAARHKR